MIAKTPKDRRDGTRTATVPIRQFASNHFTGTFRDGIIVKTTQIIDELVMKLIKDVEIKRYLFCGGKAAIYKIRFGRILEHFYRLELIYSKKQ